MEARPATGAPCPARSPGLFHLAGCGKHGISGEPERPLRRQSPEFDTARAGQRLFAKLPVAAGAIVLVHALLHFQKSLEKPAVHPPSTVSTWPVM